MTMRVWARKNLPLPLREGEGGMGRDAGALPRCLPRSPSLKGRGCIASLHLHPSLP